MLYKTYDPEVLKKIQSVELGILKDFTDLCEKHHIDYFAGGGVAIGVLRHGGFIPWDDDIDIGLTRENYEKFLRVAAQEYGDKYKIINAETTKNYPLMTTRWALRGSRFKEECFKDLEVDNGIFLDLYCYDNIADCEWKMRVQGRSAWFYGKLLVLRYVKRPTLYVNGILGHVAGAACTILHYMMGILHISPEFLYRKAKKAAMKYQGSKTGRVAYFFDPTPYTSLMKVSDIVPTKFYDFEGIAVRFPRNLEAYLERRYGDYMTMPPEEKRHNHPPYLLKFPGNQVEK